MSLPYFPMFPSDFEAKTSHLTLEEDGAYNRLLRLSWMTPGCSLPDDPAWIARRMRVDMATYERVIGPLLNEFFYRAKGRVWNRKLIEIYEETSEKHTRRVEAGKKGGRPAKPLKDKETVQSNAKAMPKQPEPEPDTLSNDNAASAADPSKLAFDAGVAMLTKAGKSPGAARSLIGKWVKAHKAEAVIVALGRAQREGAVDPVAFIEGIFKASTKAGGRNGERRQLPDGRWQSYDSFNGWVTEHV